MTVVKFIPYTNRLSKLIKLPGGKRIEDAMRTADENVSAIAPPCLEALDQHIARIQTLTAGSPTAAQFDEIYRTGNDIVGLGGVFGMADLSRAAYSLCELVDRTKERGGPGAQALKVHADSLRLLRLGDALPAAEREKVLSGLASVVQRTAREPV